jgi:hypothetical protein
MPFPTNSTMSTATTRPPAYEIWLTDTRGNTLDVIDEWLSLTYTRSVNNIGALSLELDGNYPAQFLKLDGRLIVARNGKNDSDTAWLIRKISRQLDNNGQYTIVVNAVSAVELLKRRIVAYAAGTAYADKTDQADDMMKAIVRENLGSLATDSARNISTYLAVQNDTSQGPTTSKAFSRDNVLEVLQDISNTTIVAGSAVYFDIVAPTIDTLEFRTYRDYRGVDNSYPYGLNPVVLSSDRGNLVNVTRTYDWNDEITYAYAGGQGTEEARQVTTASSRTRIGQSPLNRREGFRNASNTTDATALQDEANAALWEGRPKRAFLGELVNVPGTTEYAVHWSLGDKVTAEFQGESIDCIIEAVQVTVAGGKEDIKASLRVEES